MAHVPQWHTEIFAWHAAFTAATFFFFLCLTRVSVLYRICVYKHISDCIEIVYELPFVLYNMTSETFLHGSGVMWGVYQIFIIGVPAWPWMGKYMTLDKTFYSLLVKQELVAVSVTSRVSSLSHSSERPL
jgi:hypothetical protein